MANKHNSLSSNLLSSKRWYVQVMGALIMSKTKVLWLIGSTLILLGGLYLWMPKDLKTESCIIAAATIGVMIVIHVVHTLNPIYCLMRQESRITCSQIVLLASMGVWLIVVITQMDFKNSPTLPTIVSVVGAVLSWIFQDTIKSVVAFFYLRANDLLKIDDWIEVKPHDIDGVVKGISLTTVRIENWDTTTSAFPTYLLHSQHFRNNQKMMDGRTHGRQMLKTFIIDTGWIHTVSYEELDRIRKIIAGLKDEKKDFLENFIATYNPEEKMLNIELFRRYIYHWLMHHPHVSHEPRLIVRWLEQVPEGMPLQIYAFITDTTLAPFEWQQSRIIEHVIESMAWFNLQLYQSASGYDASNSNITLVKEEANYRRKVAEDGKIL